MCLPLEKYKSFELSLPQKQLPTDAASDNRGIVLYAKISIVVWAIYSSSCLLTEEEGERDK